MNLFRRILKIAVRQRPLLLAAALAGLCALRCSTASAAEPAQALDALKAQAAANKNFAGRFAGEIALRLEDWCAAAANASSAEQAAELEKQFSALAPRLAHAFAELALGPDGGWDWKLERETLSVCRGKPEEVGTVLGLKVSIAPGMAPRIVTVQFRPVEGELYPKPPASARLAVAAGASRYLFYEFAASEAQCAKRIEILADEIEAGAKDEPGAAALPLQQVGQIELEKTAPATLEIRVADAAESRPTQARVFIEPLDRGPFWGGPWGMARFRAMWGNERQSLNYGANFVYTDTNGVLTATVRAPGRYRVVIQKGPEYAPLERQVEAAAGGRHEIEAPLARWIHMSRLGWYSGDPHVHLRRNGASDEEALLGVMEVEDLNVMATLYCSCFDRERPVGKYGPENNIARAERILASGEEYRNCYGHFDFLNIRGSPTFHFQGAPEKFGGKMPEMQDDYPPISVVAEWAAEQGGEMVFAHGIAPGGALYVVAGRCRLTEGLQWLGFKSHDQWHRILNAGWRLFITAGTDAPNFNAPGTDRVYVHCPAGLDFSGWLAGMKAGRSFVTTGPVLLLSVNGRLPGEELELDSAGKPAKAAVRVRAAYCLPLEKVELLRNGEAIKEWTPPEGKLDWTVEEDLAVTNSCWLAARASGQLGMVLPRAHTNPVFILLDGRPIWSRVANEALLQDLRSQLANKAKPFAPRLSAEQRRGVFEHWVAPGLKALLRRAKIPPDADLDAAEERELAAAVEDEIQAFRAAFGAAE